MPTNPYLPGPYVRTVYADTVDDERVPVVCLPDTTFKAVDAVIENDLWQDEHLRPTCLGGSWVVLYLSRLETVPEIGTLGGTA